MNTRRYVTASIAAFVVIAVMIGALESLVWYVVLPIPGALAVYWFLAYVAMALAAGATVGILYRPGER